MVETLMSTRTGVFTVRRPHLSDRSPLRAWSAADQLVLDYLDAETLGRVLIVNDEFGALACGLAQTEPTIWTDSALSRDAIDSNLGANGFAPVPADRSIRGDRTPTGTFDTVVVRIPKTTALLDHQLRVVRSLAASGARLVGAGMVRHVHTSTIESFERWVGVTHTSHAKRKARLIFAEPSAKIADTALPRSEFQLAGGLRIVEHPGTFSSGHLDVGSALLLDVLASQPAPGPGSSVADLGCGNGVLLAAMAARWRDPSITYLAMDTSDLAVAAARSTWICNDLGEGFSARVADGFAGVPDGSVDVVITNPPFHQGHAVDRMLTDRLLADTARVLRPDGLAYVVVQRHLKIHTRLRAWFGSVEVASQHPTHVVLIVRPR